MSILRKADFATQKATSERGDVDIIKAVMDTDQYDYRETLTDEFISAEELRTGELVAVLFVVENLSALRRYFSERKKKNTSC